MEGEDSSFTSQIGRIIFAVRNVILSEHEVSSCIETTRLSLLVFEHYGIPARPQPVKVAAMNQLGYALRERLIPFPEWPPQAHALAIGYRDESKTPGDGWNGHLVTIVKEPDGTRHLVDGSADQMNRPPHLNVLGPVGMVIRQAWTPMDPLYRMLADGQTIIEYKPFSPLDPVGRDWRTTPAWTKRPDRFQEYAELVIASIEDSSV